MKCHHALCDGVSVVSLTLAGSIEYDRNYFVKSQDASFLQRLLIRSLVPFYIPSMLISVFSSADTNSLMKNKQNLSGNINLSSSPPIGLAVLKETSKKMKITVNDIMMCALTTALNQMFKDKNEKVSQVQLMIPANIRF
jgi:NRPS condensation-like uncharacterized protein